MLKPVCNLYTLSLNQFLNKLLDTMCLKIIYKREILQNTKRFLPTGTMEGLYIISFVIAKWCATVVTITCQNLHVF